MFSMIVNMMKSKKRLFILRYDGDFERALHGFPH